VAVLLPLYLGVSDTISLLQWLFYDCNAMEAVLGDSALAISYITVLQDEVTYLAKALRNAQTM
jgi:hypothetical protein